MAEAGAAVFGHDPSGKTTVTLGVFEGDNLALAQQVALFKLPKKKW